MHDKHWLKRIISSMNGINTWSLKLKTNYRILMNSCNQLSPGDKTEPGNGQDARSFFFKLQNNKHEQYLRLHTGHLV